VLIESAELGTLRSGVRAVATGCWDRETLRRRALEFSTERFLRQMRTWLEEASAQARGRSIRSAASTVHP